MIKLSIKLRLALLALLPAVVISVFAVHQFSINSQRVARLNQTVSNIQGLKLISEASHFVYEMEKERHQYGEEQPLPIEVKVQRDKVLAIYDKFMQNSHTVEYSNDLKQAMLDVISGDIKDSVDAGDWSFRLLQEMSEALVQHYHLFDSDEAHWMQDFIAYLAQLSYWTQKEAWLTYRLVLEPESKPNQGMFFQSIERQQQSLEGFIKLGASNEQVEKLLGLYTSPRYLSSVEARGRLMVGELSQSDYVTYLRDLDHRVQRLQVMTAGFTQEVESALLVQVSSQKQSITLMTSGVMVIIVLLCWLGFGTWYRVHSKLDSIIHSLNTLIHEHVKGEKVAVDGNDEFTIFAQQVNRMMEEQNRQTEEILKTKESAISANRAKSVFLASMSHEIRTPLNGIIGMTEILSQSDLSVHQKEVLTDIDTSSHTLLTLLNDILDLSKIESGHLQLSLIETDIREVVYQSMILFQSKATSKQLELNINLDERIPPRIMVDDHRIKQIIMNLVSNAVKFTHEGHISVDVDYQESTTQKSVFLTFRVTDTGVGIERDKLNTIFEPFTQEDEGISRQFGGTGLGLAICRQLVAMMGGKLTATSSKGIGTHFEFSIEVEVLPIVGWRSELIRTGILITDQYPYTDQIVKECRLAGIQLSEVKRIDDLTFSSREAEVIFYCHDGKSTLDSAIDELEKYVDVSRIIVCQHHLTTTYTNSERIHAVLTQPFLGNRFRHAIDELAQVEQNNKSYDVTASAVIHNINQSRTHRRILIAEDNLMNQKIASFFLDKAGYDYLIASNGQEALEAITKGEQFDAILMDCMMPVMDGLTATKEIRRWEKEVGSDKITIIALTASVLEEDIQNCFAAGMDAYLPKPYKSNQLFELFNELKLA
ncbi:MULTISPECIES: hybrid sensor histidine kinase/response regulator [Vibrio]|uniref:hybrid sensor histidine kinase/response regulator n=1 Tax=Vibrio TaxID=662 RepID=UPI000CF37002|nr:MULTISPECIES: ATP-binding protein [Vibrio]MCX2790071.1 ATP-binding protein [Vibrio sp. Sgm 5]PQJ70354.1 hybrid sensor histidine kinase/response regulator [Vibrio jasicida]